MCLVEFFCKVAQFFSIDPAVVKGDFVRRTHKLSLPVLQHAHELGCFKERIVRTSIEPGKTAAEAFDRYPPVLQVAEVQIGNLELTAGRQLELFGEVNDSLIVEVKPNCCPAGLRIMRFLLN